MPSSPAPVPKTRPRRILVVDDERDAADALRLLLELEGDDVRAAYSAPAALAEARRDPPELVICDITMPGMDGHAFARSVRADPALRRVVLLALTGHGSREVVARTREAGFDGYLLKPIKHDALRNMIESTCP